MVHFRFQKEAREILSQKIAINNLKNSTDGRTCNKTSMCTLSCFSHVQLCDPTDCSLTGSSAHGILQARILDVSLCPSPRNLPNPGIKPRSLMSPPLAGRFFTTSTTWEAQNKYESESEVAQSCLTLCDLMACSLPGSSVHGIFQARVLEWVAISFSREFSRPRD